MKYCEIAKNKLKVKSILYDIRKQMLEYYLKIKSLRNTAETLGVNLNTVFKWLK